LFRPVRTLDSYRVYLILLSGAMPLFFSIYATINLIYQVQVAHLNPLQLVLVGTALEATCFCTQVPTGVVADAYSRRLAIIVGMFLMGVGIALEGLIPRFETILLAQVLWGSGATFVDGAEEAWITDELGEARVGAAFLRGAQVAKVAGIAGILIAVGLGTLRLNLPIVVAGALFVLLGFALLAVMPEAGFHRATRGERTTWKMLGATLRDGWALVLKRPVLLTILGIAAFYGMSSEGFDRLSVAHFLRDFQFPSVGHLSPVVWFGVLDIGAMVLSIGATELVRRRVDIGGSRAITRTLFVLNALLIAGVVGFGLAGSFALAVAAYWLADVMRQTSRPLYTTWLARNIDPRVRATVFSINGQVDAFGQIAGGPVIGAIGTFASLRAALVAAGAILAPALLLFARVFGQGDEAPSLVDSALAPEAAAGASGESAPAAEIAASER
jgi:DHA3 family tetracycline resistance protein-like MFS transporter